MKGSRFYTGTRAVSESCLSPQGLIQLRLLVLGHTKDAALKRKGLTCIWGGTG